MEELKAAKGILMGDCVEIQNTSLRNNRDVWSESRPQLNKRQELMLKRSVPILNKYKEVPQRQLQSFRVEILFLVSLALSL